MKNLRVYRTGEELFALYPPIMQVPIIRFLCQVLASSGPVFMADEEHEIERGHFGTYFGCIFNRQYADPILHGLYLCHEMFHWFQMNYLEGPFTWHQWYQKMMYVEFMASIFSEVFIYYWIPALRAQTFKHPIWMDRFPRVEYGASEMVLTFGSCGLKEPVSLSMYVDYEKLETSRAIQMHMGAIAEERKRVMTNPSPFDFLEGQIHNYVQSNVAWARVWGDSFRDVEAHMSQMKRIWRQHGDGPKIEREHLAWLKNTSTSGTPFRKEAVRFLEVYKSTRSLYGNDILSK